MAKDAIQPIKVEQVLVGEIEIYERIHNFDKVRVLSLSDDMEARGLMSPILLRKMPDGNLCLVAGRHRLAAAQLLGWETIAAIIRAWVLQPGDLIYTGTPAGVGPVVAGDTLLAEVQGLPALQLTIV